MLDTKTSPIASTIRRLVRLTDKKRNTTAIWKPCVCECCFIQSTLFTFLFDCRHTVVPFPQNTPGKNIVLFRLVLSSISRRDKGFDSRYYRKTIKMEQREIERTIKKIGNR